MSELKQERNERMYLAYLTGESMEIIAEREGIAYSYLRQLSFLYKWKDRKYKEIKELVGLKNGNR